MKQLKDRPEVKPPLDAAIDTKGKLQRASFPLLQKLKLARRKKVYTNCDNKQGPPMAAALVEVNAHARSPASHVWSYAWRLAAPACAPDSPGCSAACCSRSSRASAACCSRSS